MGADSGVGEWGCERFGGLIWRDRKTIIQVKLIQCYGRENMPKLYSGTVEAEYAKQCQASESDKRDRVCPIYPIRQVGNLIKRLGSEKSDPIVPRYLARRCINRKTLPRSPNTGNCSAIRLTPVNSIYLTSYPVRRLY